MRGRWFFSPGSLVFLPRRGRHREEPARWRVRPEDDLAVPGLPHAALAEAGAGVLGGSEGRGFSIVPAGDGL